MRNVAIKQTLEEQGANRKDKVFLYILVLLTYLPLNTRGNILRIAVVGLLYLIKARTAHAHSDVKKIAGCMLISPFLSMIFVFLIDQGISRGIVVHEVMRMGYCALIILVASTLKVDFRCIYTAILLAFLPNFGIQIAQYLHISAVTAFIREYYVTSESNTFSHLDLSLYFGADFRGGSIYINPNVYMVIPLLSLVVFLQEDYRNRNTLNFVLIGCTVVSCYFCGSRTATVVLVVLILLYITRYSKGSNKFVFILFVITGLILLTRNTIEDSRAYRLSIEDSSSLTVKFQQFLWYWQTTSGRPVYWFTGSLGAANVAGIDSEWGHLYTWYGLFGLYWYIKYNRLAMRWNRNIIFYSKPMTYVCVLCAVTASVLLCMPIYSVVVVLLFANICD